MDDKSDLVNQLSLRIDCIAAFMQCVVMAMVRVRIAHCAQVHYVKYVETALGSDFGNRGRLTA